jgi:hypothetical protein
MAEQVIESTRDIAAISVHHKDLAVVERAATKDDLVPVRRPQRTGTCQGP